MFRGDDLVDRGLVDREAMHLVLQQASTGGVPIAEILVRENLVADWEVSRVAAEVFNLPFLTVESYPPSEDALSGLDPDYLRQYGLVPLDRFGQLITEPIQEEFEGPGGKILDD